MPGRRRPPAAAARARAAPGDGQDSSSLLAATFVLELELGAQQAAGIVRHALQPGLVRLAAFALAGIAWRGGPGFRFLLRAGIAFHRLAHAFALLAVGLLLTRLRGGRVFIARRFIGPVLRRAGAAGPVLCGLRRCILASLTFALSGLVFRLALSLPAGIAGLASSTLRRLATHRRLDDLAVGERVLHRRRLRQGTVVGLQCVLVAPLACQRIAEVVLGFGTTLAGRGK